MKVAIIYPEAVDLARFKEGRKEFPPFGALYMAAIMEENGHIVDVIKINDDNPTFDLSQYDAICFSVASSATFDLFKHCRQTSLISENMQLLLAGGVHAHFFPEQTLEELDVHAVCYGEGDETIIPLLNSGGDEKKLSDICNLVYRDCSGSIRHTSRLIASKFMGKYP